MPSVKKGNMAIKMTTTSGAREERMTKKVGIKGMGEEYD